MNLVQPLMQAEGGDAAAAPAGAASLGGPGDGYRLAKRDTSDPVALLRAELLALTGGARWWEKDTDWLQARAPAALVCMCKPGSAASHNPPPNPQLV